MNKKNLSVVMAGAMLATSVAPVLADTTTNEMPESQKDLLVYGIVNQMESLKLSSNDKLSAYYTSGYTGNEGKSVYGVQVVGNDGKPKDLGNATSDDKINYDVENVKANLKSTIAVGDTVKVYERGYNEFLGELVAATKPTVSAEAAKYTAEDIKTISTTYATGGNNKYIKSAKINETGTSVTLTLNTLEDISKPDSNKTITLSAGESKVNLDMPLDKDGKLLTNNLSDIHKWNSFLKNDTYSQGTVLNTKKEVSATKVVANGSDVESNNLLVSDLYDGTMLTAKGTEIVNELVLAKEANSTNPLVKLDETTPTANKSGVCEIKIGYYKNTTDSQSGLSKAYKVVTIRSTDLDETKALHNLLKTPSNYNVGVVGGNNRYETAVNVAKTKGITLSKGSVNNIVLVNGTSLVDGLAASPLVNTLGANTPLLLTESDKLPTATREYIKALTDGFTKDDRSKVTVTLVGGESVLTTSLENELKDMGFKVSRLGGDNREETSLEVAEKMVNLNADGKANAFVVGANGEADAMSISAEAFRSKTPIIVSSVHGLTKDAVKYLGANPTGSTTIIGGESVVSKDEEAKIRAVKDETSAERVTRIAGANRFETNAKIIDAYNNSSAEGKLKDTSKIAIVKDGQNNKSELVDALTASTLGNPVILATDKVSDVQKNALIKANAGVTHLTSKLYQIGNGVDSSVMTTLSKLLGIKNNAQ